MANSKDELTELSLFSGYGGMSLGLRLAGLKTTTIGYVEVDTYAVKIIRQRQVDGWLSEAPVFGDIRRFLREGWCELYQGVDLITAGWPCQDISVAGHGAGIEGERSGLWQETFECMRILRPRWCILENSPAILSGRGIDRVCRDLASISYHVRWDVVSSAESGAPHLRKRWWAMAYPDC